MPHRATARYSDYDDMRNEFGVIPCNVSIDIPFGKTGT